MAGKKRKPLAAPLLRWRCDPKWLPFQTTAEVKPLTGVIGQVAAVEALSFGLECDAPGQNIFVRGLTGTGRMTVIRRLLHRLQPVCRRKMDRCYVHNFSQPDRPRLITLPPGQAPAFRRQMQELIGFVQQGLGPALESQVVRSRREALEQKAQVEIDALTGPFEARVKKAGLALVSYQVGPVNRLTVVPVVEGKPVPEEELEKQHEAGKVSEKRYRALRKELRSSSHKLEEVAAGLGRIRRDSLGAIRAMLAETAGSLLAEMTNPIRKAYPGEDVGRFLHELAADVIDNRVLVTAPEGQDLGRLYGVNILVRHQGGESCPVVVPNTPSVAHLLGTVERGWGPKGPTAGDHHSIRAGAILRADGGYLILDVRDLLSEPGAWKALVRTLRSSHLEMVPPELSASFLAPTLKPEPIPVHLRVILVGDAFTYALLDVHDADFPDLFKVLADFDSLMKRNRQAALQYAGVISSLARDEHLLPFHRAAVAALVEHGARVAAHKGKLSARFGRVADIAREAAFLASKAGARRVSVEDVHEAVQRTKQRASLPSRRFQELLRDGTIRIQTRGRVVGQINGLAVISSGPLVYGFPARITASIGAGTAGIINIEGRASLSGAIHTKGFQILGGLLRHLLQADHALAFSASLAFEQSYGGIDGDSASGAEICCLLSALTGVPLRQDLALTGAIDQVGHLMAIGGVNEKIEGFFDTCRNMRLSGRQGVIIPAANKGDLMLRSDVVEASRQGRFHVYAVKTIGEALELLSGMPTGIRREGRPYPAGTLLHQAVSQAAEFWRRSFQSPGVLREAVPEASGAEPSGKKSRSRKK